MRLDTSFPPHEVFAHDSLLKAAKRHTAQFARTGKISVRTHTQLPRPKSFMKLGPARKIRLLKSDGILPRAVGRFVKDGTQANLLKQVKTCSSRRRGRSMAWPRPSAVIQPAVNCEGSLLPPSWMRPFPDGAVSLTTLPHLGITSAFWNAAVFPPVSHHLENHLRGPRGSGPPEMPGSQLLIL